MSDEQRSSEIAVLIALVRTAMQLGLTAREAVEPIAAWIYEHRKQRLIGWARYRGCHDPEGFFQDFMGELLRIWDFFMRSNLPPEAFWRYVRKCYRRLLWTDQQERPDVSLVIDVSDENIADDPALTTHFDLDALLDRKQVLAILRAEIAALPETSREILELTFRDAPLADHTIARRLNIPANAVRARRFRATQLLLRRVYVRLSFLSPSDVLRWPEFLTILREGDGILPRVRDTFTEQARQMISGAFAIDEDGQQVIVDALNGVIDTSSFFSYEECSWLLGDPLTARLWSPPKTIAAVRHLQVNRLVIEHAFTPHIRKSIWSNEELHDR